MQGKRDADERVKANESPSTPMSGRWTESQERSTRRQDSTGSCGVIIRRSEFHLDGLRFGCGSIGRAISSSKACSAGWQPDRLPRGVEVLLEYTGFGVLQSVSPSGLVRRPGQRRALRADALRLLNIERDSHGRCQRIETPKAVRADGRDG